MKSVKDWDWIAISYYILPCVIIGSVVEFYFGLWIIDTITKAFAVIVSFIVFRKYYFNIPSYFKYFVIAYIAYCLLTGMAYLFNNRPISCYTSDISDFILPILFVFIGMADDKPNRSFYDYFLKVLIIVLILGLICYLAGPSWYMSRMADIRNEEWYIDSDSYDENTIIQSLRFTAFFRTSYPISHFASFGLAIALFNLIKNGEKRYIITFEIVVLIIAIILSQHRVALACAGVFLLIAFIYTIKIKKINRIRPLMFIAGFSLFALIIVGAVNDRFDILYARLADRYEDMSVSNALKERKQIDEVFDSWDDVVFGQGIGSGGAAARRSGFFGITDQNYAKMLYETGVFGCLLFFLLFSRSALRALIYYRYYATELLILFFVVVAMLGSNTLVIYYSYIVTFWYAIGRIWNKAYLQQAKENKVKI